MADAADSKSVGLKTVRVQVPPPALALKQMRFRAFTYAKIMQGLPIGGSGQEMPGVFPFFQLGPCIEPACRVKGTANA